MLDWLSATGVVASAVAVFLALIAKAGEQLLNGFFWPRPARSLDSAAKESPAQMVFGAGYNDLVIDWLADAEEARKRQLVTLYTNRWMHRILAVGQYVVASVLATSFIQETLSYTAAGILGLVVLACTTLDQVFRPHAVASTAEAKVSYLAGLIRHVQEGLAAIEDEQPNAPTRAAIARIMERGLSEVSDPQLWRAKTTARIEL